MFSFTAIGIYRTFFQPVIVCDRAQLLKTGDCKTGQIDSEADEASKSVYIVAGYL